MEDAENKKKTPRDEHCNITGHITLEGQDDTPPPPPSLRSS